MGIFGNLFDLNNDGELDCFETAMEFSAFMNLIDSEAEEAYECGADEDL